MNKISRNDPCLCGSEKKYKKCCIDKVLPFSAQSNFEGGELKDAHEILEMAKEHVLEKEYRSLEDLNEELAIFSKNLNDLPKGPFLGLSPSQMHTVLYSPFTLHNELFKVETPSEEELLHVPILSQALYFLNGLQEAGEIKATQKGNLPRPFVIDLYENLFSKEKYARRPSKEEDIPQITRMKHLLDISGLIKKRSNKFSLTQKGTSLLEKNKLNELFEILFINFANKWNWAFSDGHPDLYFIQRSLKFNFLLVHKKCREWTLDNDLGMAYVEAFPALIGEVPPRSYSTPDREISCCFSLRFLNRFCVPLGLLEYREEKVKKGDFFDYLEYYRPTSFFEKRFKFQVI